MKTEVKLFVNEILLQMLKHLNSEERIYLIDQITKEFCSCCGKNKAGMACLCWHDELEDIYNGD